MTATNTSTPAENQTRTSSLDAIERLTPGAVLALGTVCALRTETGWLIAGAKKERRTWDLVRRSGTTAGTVLRLGL